MAVAPLLPTMTTVGSVLTIGSPAVSSDGGSRPALEGGELKVATERRRRRCAFGVGVARASALLRARRCVLHDVLCCCAPVYCAVQRRLGWQGCAVGCGALRVVVRLPDGV